MSFFVIDLKQEISRLELKLGRRVFEILASSRHYVYWSGQREKVEEHKNGERDLLTPRFSLIF